MFVVAAEVLLLLLRRRRWAAKRAATATAAAADLGKMKKAEEVEVEVAADPCCTILGSIE